MKIRNIIKNVSILLLFLLIFIFLPNSSNAANSNGLTELYKAPRKYFSVSDDKLSDITMTIVGDSKIKSVKCYTVNSDGSNKKSIELPSITSNNKNHIYTLSHNDLLKGNSHYFYIEIIDDNNIVHNSYFNVFVKTETINNTQVKSYGINDSTRIKNYSAANRQISFVSRDLDGIKSLKVQDMNNSNKEIYSLDALDKGNSTISLDLDKFKTENNIYNLRFITQENNSNTKSTQTVSFKVSSEAMVVTEKKYNLDFDDVTFKKVATYDTGMQYNYVQAMDYVNGNYYISTYNYISSNSSETKAKYNSLLKFNSKFGLVKNTGNILNGVKITGVMANYTGNELYLSCNQTNKVRVYDPSTLKSVKTDTIANIGTTTNAMSYDRKNNRYVIKGGNLKYYYVIDGSTNKLLKKIPRQTGSDLGQDICISGDYIIELMVETCTVDIYSISKGKYIRSDKINYSGNVKFGTNFEPEGICQISDSEFIITVASSDYSKSHMCILFYKGTLTESK